MRGRSFRTDYSIIFPLYREKHGEADGELLVVKVQCTDAIYTDLNIERLPLGVRGLQLVVVVGDTYFSITQVLGW